MTIRRSLLLASLLALILPAAVSAAPTAVDVRVEGASSTIFFGPVTTDGKVVQPAGGESHLCDGSTKIPPVGPGPTPTAALHDAAIKGGFDWAGTWFSFGDYQIDRVGPDAATSEAFWGVFVNGKATDFGGCQVIVKAGDEVLWTFDAFRKPAGALRLTAPAAIQTGQAAVVKVTNIETGAPVAGASVGGATTAADGSATLTFADPGVYVLKADKPDAIRSREARICVDPPLVESCTSADRTAPRVENTTPAVSSSATRFDYVRVSWLGDDGASGSGIRRYRAEQRRIDVPGQPWLPLVTDEPITEKRARGQEGETYEFRVQAIDRAGNSSGWVSRSTTVPFDNLSNKLRLSKRGWTTLRRQGAFKRSVSRAKRRGASATLRFSGTQATLVTRTLPTGGRIRVGVDGTSKVVSLKGKSRFRRKLIATKALSSGEHTLRITSLGRTPIEIDAIAIKP